MRNGRRTIDGTNKKPKNGVKSFHTLMTAHRLHYGMLCITNIVAVAVQYYNVHMAQWHLHAIACMFIWHATFHFVILICSFFFSTHFPNERI